MHDCAIAAWSAKGYYDYSRPVSAIRYMAEHGQSSDPSLPSYHPAGLPLIPGFIEMVDDADPLNFFAGEDQTGKVKVRCWKGPDYIEVPLIDEAGVDWIMADRWWPYHAPADTALRGVRRGPARIPVRRRSCWSFDRVRTLARRLGQWSAPMNQFLVFEDGPSVNVNLQQATRTRPTRAR